MQSEFLMAGKSVLHTCVEWGDSRLFMLVLKASRMDVNSYTKGPSTLLHIAADLGRVDLMHCLLKAGALHSLTEHTHEMTAMHLAAQRKSVAGLRLLCEVGAGLNVTDRAGMTPLHIAAQKGDTEAVRFLLERGARMNLRDANGDTALDVAIEEGNTLVSTLIEEHQVHLLRVKADRENEIAAQARQAQERINEEKNRLAYLKVVLAQMRTPILPSAPTACFERALIPSGPASVNFAFGADRENACEELPAEPQMWLLRVLLHLSFAAALAPLVSSAALLGVREALQCLWRLLNGTGGKINDAASDKKLCWKETMRQCWA
ncbi:hypothetical protein CYMTET_32989 [Cymbomonas tetramitiformis]|uniref:Ankyrin repeat protein n=1 Tax=Cymbomonas tetramitiformis TaxID=36881 RepID=A0AAE0KRE6_9CHLO|nr:hypothetical protein CYMTET_32989 [Cymbomonas tetramitiformis]